MMVRLGCEATDVDVAMIFIMLLRVKVDVALVRRYHRSKSECEPCIAMFCWLSAVQSQVHSWCGGQEFPDRISLVWRDALMYDV